VDLDLALEILKWVGLVILAGFLGQFGKSLALHLLARRRSGRGAAEERRRAEKAAAKVEKKRLKAQEKAAKKGEEGAGEPGPEGGEPPAGGKPQG
jgi:hypothetical protein